MIDGLGFGTPHFIFLIVIVPVGVLLTLLWASWREQARRAYGLREQYMWRELALHMAPTVVLVAVAFLAFAAARPQWGEREVVVEQGGIDVVFVLDVSNSMLAQDAEPTRLARAQDEIDALLGRMQGDRAGLVIFAGDALVRSPLSPDLGALRTIVRGVDAERGLVLPGSDIAAAMDAALELIDEGGAEAGAIVLVSDGEIRGGSLDAAVARVRESGTPVFAAGVGTEAGAPVRDIDPRTLEAQDRIGRDGAPVITRLDSLALRALAEAGGGRYVALEGEGRPLTSFAADFGAMEQTAFGERESSRPAERFRLFAAIALALIIVEALVVWWPRLPRAWLRPLVRAWPLAGAGVLVAGVCAVGVADVNRRGNQQYAAGDYQAALELYRTAQAMAPERDEAFHNAANALHQQGDYAAAIEELRKAFPVEEELAGAVEYALGKHFAADGRLQEAYEAFKRSLLADPDDRQAKHNLEVILKLLRPAPSPTPTLGAETPPAGSMLTTPQPSPGAGDPGAAPGGTAEPAGTPQPGGTPGPQQPQPRDPRGLSDEELQRELEEALSGIEREYSEEEARRVLELLEERNRRLFEEQVRPPGGGLPDY